MVEADLRVAVGNELRCRPHFAGFFNSRITKILHRSGENERSGRRRRFNAKETRQWERMLQRVNRDSLPFCQCFHDNVESYPTSPRQVGRRLEARLKRIKKREIPATTTNKLGSSTVHESLAVRSCRLCAVDVKTGMGLIATKLHCDTHVNGQS